MQRATEGFIVATPNMNNRRKAQKKRTRSKLATTDSDKKVLLQEFLELSLTDGSFIDTKFYAFSRRRSTGVVDEPLPVYANSGMLCESSKYFDGFFNAGFQVKLAPLRSPFPPDKLAHTEEYDYGSDSDLEDEDEAERAPKVEGAEDEGSGPSEASPPTKSEDATYTEAASAAPNLTGPATTEFSLLDANVENYGHVIVVPDVAFATWKALIFWIYTGEVTFARLKSQGVQSDNGTASQPAKSLQCSPKSMYRLADKCGLDELKKIALDDIRSKLSTENIAVELRSTLPSLYEEVRSVVVAFACRSAQSVVTTLVPQWIDDLAAGKLVESADTLKALYKKSASASVSASAGAMPPQWNTNRCGSCRTQGNLNMSEWYRYCNYCGAYRAPGP